LDPWLPLLILSGLVVLAALAAGGEIALLSLNPLRVEAAARKGRPLARLQQGLRKHPQRMLTTLIVATTVLNTTLATYAATVSETMIAPHLHLSRQQALVFSTLFVTIVIVLVCDLVPKTLGAVRAEAFAGLITRPIWLLDKLLAPLHWVVNLAFTPLLQKLTGGRLGHEHIPSIEEVRLLLSQAQAGGRVEHTDALVAQEALTFSTKDLADVMTPRVDVIAVPDTATVGQALTAMVQSGFSRLPMFHEDIDEIVGVLLLKDLVTFSLQRAEGGRDPLDLWASEPALPLMREVVRYPVSKGVDETLAELRRERTHLAVVVDEHGGTAGVVTMEDILEELVGDIQDESDSAHSADVVRRSGGVLLVTGRARLDALPELDQVEIGETDATTLGGLLMERLGRPAVVGDSIVLPAKPGYVPHNLIPPAPTGGHTPAPVPAAGANGQGHGPGKSEEPERPAAQSLKVTALKVLRTRIKLMKVEPLRDASPPALP
jgi:CBS domain containing-hemolysin-like protein